MRVNLPVTGTEYELSADAALVSRTDLKGRITYVNPAFVEASGFGVAELMGKAHNIVRHPDVPPEAFTDLWRTLGQGLPWTGLITTASQGQTSGIERINQAIAQMDQLKTTTP